MPNKMIEFAKYKLVAFDLDGTLHLGDRVVDGALELVDKLRRYCQVAYLTNNSTKTRPEIASRLQSMGFPAEPANCYTSAFAAALYLQESPVERVFIIGSAGLASEIKSIRKKISDSAEDAQAVVVGLDFDFNYEKLKTALQVLLQGGMFIACNEDPSFPAGDGRHSPGCGAMVGALAGCACRQPDAVAGKPNTLLLEKMKDDYKVSAGEILVIGDSLESDIKMAENFGCDSILVGENDSGSPELYSIKGILNTMKEKER